MSPLIKRILHEKRSILIPLAIALISNVLVYEFAVRPRAVKAAGAADRAVAAKLALRGADRDLTVAQSLVEGKAKADDELNAFYQKVLPPNRDAAVQMTYTTLPAIASSNHVRMPRRNYDDEKPSADSRLGRLGITMILQGDYENLRAFIYELETAPQFIILDDLSITEGKPNEALTLTLRMSTYYRLTADGV